jgi:hypothetical protein
MLFLGSANGKTILKHALAAGLTMGLSYVLIKWTLDASDFISGIFWTRIGFIVSALLSLISKRARSEIVSSFKMAKASSRVIFVGNKSLSGIAFLLLYYAISLGNVAFVNSLLGFQFLFILIIALLLRNRLPAIGENLERNILIRKLVGIALVITGFLFMINPI